MRDTAIDSKKFAKKQVGVSIFSWAVFGIIFIVFGIISLFLSYLEYNTIGGSALILLGAFFIWIYFKIKKSIKFK